MSVPVHPVMQHQLVCRSVLTLRFSSIAAATALVRSYRTPVHSYSIQHQCIPSTQHQALQLAKLVATNVSIEWNV